MTGSGHTDVPTFRTTSFESDGGLSRLRAAYSGHPAPGRRGIGAVVRKTRRYGPVAGTPDGRRTDRNMGNAIRTRIVFPTGPYRFSFIAGGASSSTCRPQRTAAVTFRRYGSGDPLRDTDTNERHASPPSRAAKRAVYCLPNRYRPTADGNRFSAGDFRGTIPCGRVLSVRKAP